MKEFFQGMAGCDEISPKMTSEDKLIIENLSVFRKVMPFSTKVSRFVTSKTDYYLVKHEDPKLRPIRSSETVYVKLKNRTQFFFKENDGVAIPRILIKPKNIFGSSEATIETKIIEETEFAKIMYLGDIRFSVYKKNPDKNQGQRKVSDITVRLQQSSLLDAEIMECRRVNTDVYDDKYLHVKFKCKMDKKAVVIEYEKNG
ncbi:MAG: hypothetical protein ACI8TE_001466 [Francisella sp.]|jgi:hypothetical protein